MHIDYYLSAVSLRTYIRMRTTTPSLFSPGWQLDLSRRVSVVLLCSFSHNFLPPLFVLLLASTLFCFSFVPPPLFSRPVCCLSVSQLKAAATSNFLTIYVYSSLNLLFTNNTFLNFANKLKKKYLYLFILFLPVKFFFIFSVSPVQVSCSGRARLALTGQSASLCFTYAFL